MDRLDVAHCGPTEARPPMALTIRRASEIHDGRGEPPTAEELEQYERGQALAQRAMAKMLPQIEQGALDAQAAGGIVGCGLEEVTEIHGERFGDLTAQDILERGDRGLRGRRALDAALVARRPLGAKPLLLRPSPRRVVRRYTAGRTPRGRRTRPTSSSRGSPRRRSSDDPHHDVVAPGGVAA